MRTSAADHKDPAVPAIEVPIYAAGSVISVHFHAAGLTTMHTYKSTQPTSVDTEKKSCTHRHTQSSKHAPKCISEMAANRDGRRGNSIAEKGAWKKAKQKEVVGPSLLANREEMNIRFSVS